MWGNRLVAEGVVTAEEVKQIDVEAAANFDRIQTAMKAGALDYILKPFNLSAVEASITACLSRSAYKKQKGWWKR